MTAPDAWGTSQVLTNSLTLYNSTRYVKVPVWYTPDEFVHCSTGVRLSTRTSPDGERAEGAVAFNVEPSGLVVAEVPDSVLPPEAAVPDAAAPVGDVGDFLSPPQPATVVTSARPRATAFHLFVIAMGGPFQ